MCGYMSPPVRAGGRWLIRFNTSEVFNIRTGGLEGIYELQDVSDTPLLLPTRYLLATTYLPFSQLSETISIWLNPPCLLTATTHELKNFKMMMRQKHAHSSKKRKTHNHVQSTSYHNSTATTSSDFAGFIDPILDGSAIFDELSQKRQANLTNLFPPLHVLDLPANLLPT